MNLMNDDGRPLFRLPHEEGYRFFARNTVVTHDDAYVVRNSGSGAGVN